MSAKTKATNNVSKIKARLERGKMARELCELADYFHMRRGMSTRHATDFENDAKALLEANRNEHPGKQDRAK